MGEREGCWLAMWVATLPSSLVSGTLSAWRCWSVLEGGGHLVVNIVEAA